MNCPDHHLQACNGSSASWKSVENGGASARHSTPEEASSAMIAACRARAANPLGGAERGVPSEGGRRRLLDDAWAWRALDPEL